VNLAWILAAAEEAEEPSPFLTLLSHLVPHRYGWSPDIHLGPFDLSISNAVVNIWLAAALVIGLFWVAASKPKIVPRGIQNLIEVAMNWVKDNIVYSVMRPADARVWFPFIGTIFFFVLLMNAVGLIPVIGFTPTSNIYLTATLAFGVYLLAIAIGMARHGVFHFWKVTLIPEGLPGKNPLVKGLATGFFLLVETISQLARPFSLAVRLFANMLADHVILLIFVGFIFLAGGAVLIAVLPLAMALEIVFTGFALFVAFIQAVIFAFLSTIYINDALHPGH
jgi:F-type H+-transporting ATPase subunit a